MKQILTTLAPSGLRLSALMRPCRRARGQALVETLMVIPILLMLLIGLIDIGQLLLANYTVSQAARAAAHQAALAGGNAQAANQTAADVLDGGVGTRADDAAILVACTHSPCRRYDPITVSITYVGNFWTPLPPLFEQFTLRGEATRAAERDEQ
ncbi:pilus assembly protein [Oscillochloris sp. ZM17-4]|uniref:TadE/TadG family type IV pilus assembly protein n=1 Tax=Oscillochloris sp. ZM17-4 TaxID=2866714 RepID=UPI001C730147|nr:TadE/TadG family type IV pilus assembly protein [Oscillochloris sp. ZM17-4]MBX0330271.1 pilus assembly protein [Oscillochloris sp. ZM17-4]